MAQKIKRRKRKHCGKFFLPDSCNATRQRYCSKPECRKATCPGYWRRKQENRSTMLQDPLNQQVPENNHNKADFISHALQDSSILQPGVFIGLIAQLTGYALQEDIA